MELFVQLIPSIQLIAIKVNHKSPGVQKNICKESRNNNQRNISSSLPKLKKNCSTIRVLLNHFHPQQDWISLVNALAWSFKVAYTHLVTLTPDSLNS